MPLSEFLRMARGKLESGQQKTCPNDVSSRVENELVELVWENGQIMMQGQSSRATRSPDIDSLQANTPRVRVAGVGNSTGTRIGRFGGDESILNDIPPVVPSGELNLSQDDEMVPWLNFPLDDGLPHDYCSGLLPEISGVTATGISTQHNFVSPDKRNSCEQTVNNLHNGGNRSKGSSKSRLLCSWPPQQGQTSDPSLVSGVSDVISNNTSNHGDVIFGNIAHGKDMINDAMRMKVTRPNMGMSYDNSSVLNFSHFSRPASLVKANIPNYGGMPTVVSLGMDRMEGKEKVPASRGTNSVKYTLDEQLNCTRKDFDFHVPSAKCGMVNSRQEVAEAPKGSFAAERIEKLCQFSSIKNDKPSIESNATIGVRDGERMVEPMVASSSVGSDNCADRVSCEKTHNSKRKFCETEESECRSDDIETEYVGANKATPAGGNGSKRSRAAEVHNLSERRRRDRINEKMRALQELVPNCNKADKASMLDEAIEYLKALQLQVQIMSMGAGLCMPPMMFPPGIQHMHPAHLPHFSPMGMGMGMGMGFGMGMLDMNGGGSLGCPIFPVPPMQGAHFPPPVSGPPNFPIPGSNFPVYGHPSQGLPNSVPRAPLVPLMQPLANSAMGLNTSKIMSHNEVQSTSPTLNSVDPLTNKNSQPMHNVEASSSRNHISNQPQGTDEVLDQSPTVQDGNQPTDVTGNAALSSAVATDFSKETGCD